MTACTPSHGEKTRKSWQHTRQSAGRSWTTSHRYSRLDVVQRRRRSFRHVRTLYSGLSRDASWCVHSNTYTARPVSFRLRNITSSSPSSFCWNYPCSSVETPRLLEAEPLPRYIKRFFIDYVDDIEAHFWLNDFVTKQNCHYWGESNPRVVQETQLHPQQIWRSSKRCTGSSKIGVNG